MNIKKEGLLIMDKEYNMEYKYEYFQKVRKTVTESLLSMCSEIEAVQKVDGFSVTDIQIGEPLFFDIHVDYRSLFPHYVLEHDYIFNKRVSFEPLGDIYIDGVEVRKGHGCQPYQSLYTRIATKVCFSNDINLIKYLHITFHEQLEFLKDKYVKGFNDENRKLII
jgi:hypothetical protein